VTGNRDLCDSALPLQCDEQVQGSNADSQGGNQWETYWSDGESGPEVIYELEHDGGYLTIELNSGDSSDLDLILLQSCAPQDCLEMSAASGSHEDIRRHLAAGTYYVVVDSHDWNGADYSFTLELGCVDTYSDAGPVNCQGSWESEPNEGWNADPPNSNYDDIAFGETVCGSLWADSGSRDLDWFRFIHPGGGFFAYARTEQADCILFLMDFAEGGVVHAESDNVPVWTRHSMAVEDLPAGEYFIVIAWNDFEGLAESIDYALVISTEALDSVDPPAVSGFTLAPTYPNPCNPTTTLRWSQPQPLTVKLTLFNILGEAVRAYELGRRPAGTNSFVLDGSDLPSGVYVYTLQTQIGALSEKLLLVK
jgi:hypothetical protein